MTVRFTGIVCLALTIVGLGRQASKAAEVALDDPKDNCVLASLIGKADLIVIGTVTHIMQAPGHLSFHLLEGTVVDYVADIQVERVVASVRDAKEIASDLRKDAGPPYSISVSKIAAVVAYGPHPVLNDPSLLDGGRYLLWLRDFRLPEQDIATLGVKSAASYRVVSGPLGAILLSDPATMPGHKARQETGSDPLKGQKEMLEKRFGGADAQTVVKATEEFVLALTQEKAKADEQLKQLAGRPEKIYAITADRLAKAEKRKHLFLVDLRAISPGSPARGR